MLGPAITLLSVVAVVTTAFSEWEQGVSVAAVIWLPCWHCLRRSCFSRGTLSCITLPPSMPSAGQHFNLLPIVSGRVHMLPYAWALRTRGALACLHASPCPVYNTAQERCRDPWLAPCSNTPCKTRATA